MNDEMPRHVLGLAANGLRSSGKPLRRARVTVLGISYRPNVKETRFSPALELISLLRRRGARVTVHDPKFSCDEIGKLGLVAEPTLKKAVEKADCVIIAVAHDEFKRLDARDLTAAMSRSPVIVDCVHIMDPASVEKSRATYRGVGRGLWTR
jgi:UDP-N-acetyl-D-mannosaminuronate dehydrogenase